MNTKYFAFLFISIMFAFAISGNASASVRTHHDQRAKTVAALPATITQSAQERVRTAREKANQRMTVIQDRMTQRLAKKRFMVATTAPATATSTAESSAASTGQ